MSDPLLTKTTDDDVLPYVPNWARHPGHRPAQPEISYDAFSEEENPSYRTMAQMFAPQSEPARRKKKSQQTSKMLLRFSAVVGAAALALAVFLGYVTIQPGRTDATRAKVEKVIESVRTALTAPRATSTPDAPVAEVGTPIEATVVASLPAPASPAEIVTDRAAAAPLSSTAPPPVEAKTPEAAPSPVVATIAPETAAPTLAPAVPQLSAGELSTLMARGHRFIESGDFSSARPVYRRAAEAGYAEAALALGETYDPAALAERGAIGMQSDVEQAREWYLRARDMGSLEAPTRLERLPPG